MHPTLSQQRLSWLLDYVQLKTHTHPHHHDRKPVICIHTFLSVPGLCLSNVFARCEIKKHNRADTGCNFTRV